MKKCKSCGKELDNSAKLCPGCGLDLRNWFKKHKISTGIAILIVLVLVVVSGTSDKGTNTNKVSSKISEESKKKNFVNMNTAVKGSKFETTITNSTIKGSIDVGNVYLNVKAENDIKFVVLNSIFKNIDKESRMLFDGKLIINYNGQELTFDKSETILSDGYGIFLDQINPLSSKKTKLVYKISSKIKGPAYYKPYDSKELTYIGDL
ncbi:MAG: hypothetical protein ACRC6K_04500 [Fusobacteriaceae bacterium]